MLSPLQRASAKDKNNPNKHRKQGHLKFISAPLAPSRRRGDPRYFNKACFGLALNFTNLTIPEDYKHVPTTSFAEALSFQHWTLDYLKLKTCLMHKQNSSLCKCFDLCHSPHGSSMLTYPPCSYKLCIANSSLHL